MALILIAVLLVGAGAIWWAYNQFRGEPTNSVSVVGSSTPKADNVGQLTLDTTKNYGDKYADGILPVGDDKLVTDAPKTGYVYTCSQYAQNQNGGGADTRGPWFTNNNTEYDLNKKINVQGSKTWSASFSNKVSGDTRTIATNDLPDHHTGIFPILSSDPAYQYDRNPNSITGQTLTYALAASPTYSSTPHCMGGEAGVMLTGVALFNGFDAGARDAGAWEIQDDCSGHPQKDGEYHYHTLSSCITDTSVSKVIGFALDGFPITGPKLGPTNILTTSDLDECHGITSKVTLDGKQVTTYHYVMTQDFPYSISCFRGTPIDPPGQHSEGTSQQQSQQQGGQLPPPGQLPPR
ncbi:YHYH protein [Candidatus Saccharibacteria bacterium]|nr:YHYH protein [Candidatus Saccharibacteria bacterium]